MSGSQTVLQASKLRNSLSGTKERVTSRIEEQALARTCFQQSYFKILNKQWKLYFVLSFNPSIAFLTTLMLHKISSSAMQKFYYHKVVNYNLGELNDEMYSTSFLYEYY
jgi:hypothetical protein